MLSQATLPLLLSFVALGIFLAIFTRRPRVRRSLDFRADDYKAKPLLTRWELAALGEMRRELPQTLHICPQVRLADLLDVIPTEPGQRQVALNRVASKSVDFAVIDTAGRVLLVVEIDDRTHERPDRRERDRLVDAVLRHCGIPVRRVRPGQPVAAGAVLDELARHRPAGERSNGRRVTPAGTLVRPA